MMDSCFGQRILLCKRIICVFMPMKLVDVGFYITLKNKQ